MDIDSKIVEVMEYFNLAIKTEDPKTEVSWFWTEYHQKRLKNFLNKKELLNMRRWEGRRAMGDPPDGCTDKIWHDRAVKRARAVPSSFIKNLTETDFGNPIKFKSHLGSYSGPFILNTISTCSFFL